MSEFKAITTKEREKWNSIVKKFKEYEVFYLNEYVAAFEALGKDQGLLLWYDNESTRAMTVVFKRDVSDAEVFEGKIQRGRYFDLQTPYGYGGMQIEGPDKEVVWKAYRKWCKEQNIVSEFVRFSLFAHGENYYEGKVETRTHNIVRPLEMPIEEIYADFEHKVRKNIKKAERNELEAFVDENGVFFEEFLKIYYDTMERNQAKDEYYFPREFFERFLRMQENAAWFYVKKEDKIIAAELVIYNENSCYSYLGGTLADFFEFRPNELLKVEVMKWAQQKGIKYFVLGGGYGEDDGIFKYKKSFSPNGIVDFYIGMNILNKEAYEQLLEIRQKEEQFDADTSFFPKYRG